MIRFNSVPELEAAIDDYLVKHDEASKPFAWTATAPDILQKVDRARDTLKKVKSGTSWMSWDTSNLSDWSPPHHAAVGMMEKPLCA